LLQKIVFGEFMKKVKIFILLSFLFVGFFSFSFNFVKAQETEQPAVELEDETVSVLTQLKDYFKNISGEFKKTLQEMNINSPEIKFVSSLPGNRGRFGLQIAIGAGLGDSSLGFNPVAINILSPSIKDLRLPKIGGVLKLVPDLNNSRLLNLILNVNLNPYERNVLRIFKEYRDSHNGQMSSVEKFIVSIRYLMEPAFAPFIPFFFIENTVLYFKPIQIAGIKFALLLKTYARSDKNRLAQELPLFFSKFLNSADWDKTKSLPENKDKPFRLWTNFVKFEDPEVLDKLIPKFVKDLVDNLPLDVNFAEYLEVKDGITPYLSKLSEVWRRGSVDSKAFFFIEQIVPEFENKIMNPTEIRKTAIAIATMCNDFNKANLANDTKERLIAVIDDFIEALNKSSLVGPLSSWKNLVTENMKELKKSLEGLTAIDFDISKLDMTQDRKLTLIELISYYKKKAEQLLNYKHIGETGYIFETSELNRKQALFLLLAMTYRLNKDVKNAMKKAELLKSDIQVQVGDKTIAIGPNAYAQRVGKPGDWNSTTNRWKVEGSGLIFEEQKALMILKKTNLKDAQYARLKRSYIVAKDKRKTAQAKYAFDVARGIKIPIGIEEKTPYSAFLSDFNILVRRFEKAKPLIEAIKEIYESVGLPFPTERIEEDLKKSSTGFDEGFFVEEGGFGDFEDDIDWGSGGVDWT
jgi:hypothetical protein